jgi:16S rRNA processing protein RimM
MSESAKQKYITVARILRPRGNKGEVSAELLTDFPERLSKITEFSLAAANGTRRGVKLRSFWVDRNHPDKCVFHFVGVDSINDAELLRELEIQIPFEQRAVLPTGSFFISDLIGCSVFEVPAADSPVASSPCSLTTAPSLLGKVRDVYFPGEGQPGTPLLALDTEGDEMLIPLAEDICTRIDTAAHRIEVKLPDGLRDLNS